MRFTPAQAAEAERLSARSMVGLLGIRFSVDDEGRLCATMPVDERTVQPLGQLHGGATAALAETLGSVGSALIAFPEGRGAAGIELNVNHLRSVREGHVTATGELLHQGRTTHVWEVRVRDAEGRLIAVCRLTNLITERP